MTYRSRHQIIEGKNWHPSDVLGMSVDDLVNGFIKTNFSGLSRFVLNLGVANEGLAENDFKKGRFKLADAGRNAARNLGEAYESLKEIVGDEETQLFTYSMEELGLAAGDLDYVEMEKLVWGLCLSIKQVPYYIEKGNFYLTARRGLRRASLAIGEARKISEPYMYKEN